MWITLATPLLPHDSARLELAWSYVPPLTPSDGREGRDDHLYLMGYWYPQVAVYDDVNGWMADPYLLEAEFYMDPADYDVRVTVPRGWVVGATGSLQNAAEVLTPAARARLAEARRTGAWCMSSEPGRRRRAFAAGCDRDVALHGSQRARLLRGARAIAYAWDATRALVGVRRRDRTPWTSTASIAARAARAAWAARRRALHARRDRAALGVPVGVSVADDDDRWRACSTAAGWSIRGSRSCSRGPTRCRSPAI